MINTHSKIYQDFINESTLGNITNSQAKFICFLLEHEDMVKGLGSSDSVFASVRYWLKHKKK